MIKVKVLLPPIAVGEVIHTKKGEIIELTEADVEMWERSGVVKRLKAASVDSGESELEDEEENSGAPESAESIDPVKPVKKR